MLKCNIKLTLEISLFFILFYVAFTARIKTITETYFGSLTSASIVNFEQANISSENTSIFFSLKLRKKAFIFYVKNHCYLTR